MRAKLVFDVDVKETAKHFPLTVSFSLIEVEGADISVPATALAVAAPKLAPLALTGELYLHVAHLTLDRAHLVGKALVRWPSAGSALTRVSPLGSYEMHVESAGTAFRASLRLAGLFLPAVVRLRGREWLPAASLKTALTDTAIMVTAFTLAHALTLSLAATGLFSPPTRWVESGVAASVLFVGLNNLVPMVYRGLFWLAAAFGLVHGAAIAGALIELGLPAGDRVWALLAFNLGVEAAQLAVLLLVIPPSFVCRRSRYYRWLVVVPGSLFVTIVGLLWLIQRTFEVDLGIPLF